MSWNINSFDWNLFIKVHADAEKSLKDKYPDASFILNHISLDTNTEDGKKQFRASYRNNSTNTPLFTVTYIANFDGSFQELKDDKVKIPNRPTLPPAKNI